MRQPQRINARRHAQKRRCHHAQRRFNVQHGHARNHGNHRRKLSRKHRPIRMENLSGGRTIQRRSKHPFRYRSPRQHPRPLRLPFRLIFQLLYTDK